MRILILLSLIGVIATAQQIIEVKPLQAADLNSPYASPRDAARHRLSQTLADLESKRDIKAAVRGFGDAFAKDQGYAAAAFNLGVTAAAAGKWEEAIAALEEAIRLEPALSRDATPQLGRLRLIAELEKSAEGQRQRRYDEALFPLLDKLPKMPPAAALFALADVGRIDPRRWEAPALIASLQTDYEIAAKFLLIAAANATSPEVRAALQKAQAAAEREIRYVTARAAAEIASDAGDHAKAAELFESAWTAIPARGANGINAAAEMLLENDSARAAALLTRLRSAPDAQLSGRASAMLKFLEEIEPAAKAATSSAMPAGDPGTLEPPRIAPMLPAIDRSRMEVLAVPLPKLQIDPEPPALLSSFAADPAQAGASLPELPEPEIKFETVWRDVQAVRQAAAAALAPAPRPTEMADLAQGVSGGKFLITSEPANAAILIDTRAEPICHTPCQLTVEQGSHQVRISLAGFKPEERPVLVTPVTEDLFIPLEVLRGIVAIEGAGNGAFKINDQVVDAATPVSLFPGLYRFTADYGSVKRERLLTVKPGANLRLKLTP